MTNDIYFNLLNDMMAHPYGMQRTRFLFTASFSLREIAASNAQKHQQNQSPTSRRDEHSVKNYKTITGVPLGMRQTEQTTNPTTDIPLRKQHVATSVKPTTNIP